MTLIAILQVFAALGWLPGVFYYARPTWRLLRGTEDPLDTFRALLFFVALTHVGFTVRWLAFAEAVRSMSEVETQVWAILYLMTALEGLGLVVASVLYDRLRGKRWKH